MNTRPEATLPPGESHAPASPISSTMRDVSVTNPESEERMTRRRSSAWDPYEVWKTRIKTPNRAS